MNRRKFLSNTGWSCLGLAAVSSIITQCKPSSSSKSSFVAPGADASKIFFGDIHNHCNLTYGHGDMKSAFEAARQQLDFVAVTPHALWPDIPGANDERLKWVIDYHTGAFARLRKEGWPKYAAMTKVYNREGEFLTFISYECHSMEHGDHVVLHHDLDAPLLEANSVPHLMEQLKGQKAFITPHHMGYQTGYRGYNWNHFMGGDQTPFVEMFSRHGLAESDLGDYNYLHDMGPRVYEATVQYGLSQGHKFGLIGSTDQHAGYPGSYGDGRVAVLAPDLSRDSLWEAMRNRRVYCVTGDKIKIDFRINDALMGDAIKGNHRTIYFHVEGENFIDYVDLIKNGKCIARLNGPYTSVISGEETIRAKVKIDFGWNRSEEPVRWDGALKISDGVIHQATPCFRGAAYTSPQKNKISTSDLHETNVNRILSKADREVNLEMYSVKNPNVLTPALQAVILDVTMPKSALLTASFNGQSFSHSLDDLLNGSKAHFMNGWLSESINFNRAAPISAFTIEHGMIDDQPEMDTDYYYLRVRQRDNQWAWSTPVWVERV